MAGAQGPRQDRRAGASEVRVLERGAGLPLVVDAARLRQDKRALAEVLQRRDSVTLSVSTDDLRPSDAMLTTLWETASGFPLVLELSLEGFDLRAESVVVEIFPDTLDNLFVREGVQGARSIDRSDLLDVLTRAEDETNYFCHRQDGHGGAIARGSIGVAIDGALVEVPVSLRRDAFQQAEMQLRSGDWVPATTARKTSTAQNAAGQKQATTPKAAKKKKSKKSRKVWVISWFSDECEEDDKGKCPQTACDVPLTTLRKIALSAGLDGAGAWLADKIIDELLDIDIVVGGTCGEVEFII
ncbi:MAG: hypothetical protein QF464_10955, partial [Myxococcota bacterium]|nr:hypothetical protein [Myxococcota bacterium]